MKIFKVTGNVIAKIFGTVENVADLVSDVVGDNGLKPMVRYSFDNINYPLAASAIMAKLEAEHEIVQFKLKHNLKGDLDITLDNLSK
jgi:hypothetical protein